MTTHATGKGKGVAWGRVGCSWTYSSDMVDEDRPDEVVLPLVFLAQGGTLLLSVLHQPLNEVGTALTDHWSDGTVILLHATNQPISLQ